MRVIVTLEYRFHRTPDNAVWTSSTFPHEFWLRYRDVFDLVRVVGRVQDVASVPTSYHRVDGDGVEFHAVTRFEFIHKCAAGQEKECRGRDV